MLPNAELFLMTPLNKPPFIGVAYEHDRTFYADANSKLLHLRNTHIDLFLEKKDNQMHITLQVRGRKIVKRYTANYNTAALRTWLEQVSDAKRDELRSRCKEPFRYV